jgi:hypothetical protein
MPTGEAMLTLIEKTLPRALLKAAVAATFLAIMSPCAGAAETPPPQFSVGRSAAAPAPVAVRQIRLNALPDASAADIAARPQFRIGPLTGASASVFAERKALAAKGGAPSPNAQPGGAGTVKPPVERPAGVAPASAPIQTSFAGNTEKDCARASPSDQALAVGDGSEPILQVNQDCVSVWSPSGTRLLGPKTLQAFAGLPASTYVFDPRALYDWHNHRFILAFGDSDLVGSSFYDIAVSQSDDPTGAWSVWRFPTPSQGQVLNDFIRLGQDRQGVYIASNLFPMMGSCCGSFLWEEWVLLPKSLLYSGGPLSYWYLSGIQAYNQYTDSTQPVNVWSPYDNPRAEFLVGSFNMNYGGGNCVTGCGNLLNWAISNQFGWLNGNLYPPVVSAWVSGSFTYYLPPNASQPGAPNSIDTLDTRITGQASYNSGFVYAALTTADSNWSDIQSYRIAPMLGNDDPNCAGSFAGDCPRMIGALTVDSKYLSGNGNFYYYPTAQSDLEGNVTVVYNFSGPSCANCFPSVGYVTERVTQPNQNFFDNGQLFGTGSARYLQPAWGRYTAAAAAKLAYGAGGVDTPGIWVAGAFAKPDGSWATQIGYTGFTAPNQP